MTTAVLDEFRRQFIAAKTGKQPLANEARSISAHPLDNNYRVIVFGPNSIEALKNIALNIGRTSTIVCADNVLSRVRELRRQIAALEAGNGQFGITTLYVDWSDLRTDYEWLEQRLRDEPVDSLTDFFRLKEALTRKGQQQPLVADGSFDFAIVSELNAVRLPQLLPCLREILRSLANQGRLILNCLVSDEPLADDQLGSLTPDNSIEHIPTEYGLLAVLEKAGFYGVEITCWDKRPVHTIQSIEVRSVEVKAFKGKDGPCYDANQAVIYRGPWQRVHDDDGHVYRRGERTAVCEKTYRLLTSEPYQTHFIPMPPHVPVPVENLLPFDCHGVSTRDPKVTKGLSGSASTSEIEECSGDCAC
jgi:arsenite methyltransferase